MNFVEWFAQAANEVDPARFWINEAFSGVLASFYALIPSFGLAIILLTITVRLVLLPLSIKQTRSMREMQRIQPEIKKLQAKYKGNRQKMNEELMALYKEHQVNPFGGCFPLLLQMPVLFALFYVIRSPLNYLGFAAPESGVQTADYVARPASGIMETLQNSSLAQNLQEHALSVNQFLGIRLDCSSSAALSGADPSGVGEVCGSGVVSALPYLVFVVLMGFTTWYQQKQMQARTTPGDAQAQQMQMFMRIMPFMLMVFAFSFPTGVVLYWLTTNVWQIGQQRLMFHAAPPLDASGKPKTPKPGGGNGSGGKPARTAKPEGKSGAAETPPGAAKTPPGADGAGVRPKASKPHPSSKKKKRR